MKKYKTGNSTSESETKNNAKSIELINKKEEDANIVLEKATKKLRKMLKNERKKKKFYSQEETNEVYDTILNCDADPIRKQIAEVYINFSKLYRASQKLQTMDLSRDLGLKEYSWDEYDEVLSEIPGFEDDDMPF